MKMQAGKEWFWPTFEGALQKPRALPPTNNSGKEKLPSKRKKPFCFWPAGWRRRRRGGQIEKRRDHKSCKYNKPSIQEMCGSVGSEVGRSGHSYEVGNSCRWIWGQKHTNYTRNVVRRRF